MIEGWLAVAVLNAAGHASEQRNTDFGEFRKIAPPFSETRIPLSRVVFLPVGIPQSPGFAYSQKPVSERTANVLHKINRKAESQVRPTSSVERPIRASRPSSLLECLSFLVQSFFQGYFAFLFPLRLIAYITGVASFRCRF